MISDERLLSIQQELAHSKNLNAFILKYHTIKDAEVQCLVIIAHWGHIQSEEDIQHKLVLIKRFRNQHRHHQDVRIKRLLILADAFIVQHAKELTAEDKNELCNEIIELSPFVDEKEYAITIAVINAYAHKAQQLDPAKDSFKAEYFYNRMLLLSHNLTGIEYLRYNLKTQVAKILLAMKQDIDVTERVGLFFEDFPEHAEPDMNEDLLTLIYTFLQYTSPYQDEHLKDRIDTMERLIKTPKFSHIINASLESNHVVGGILQYLTYLFWVDRRSERADALAQQYFQYENKPLQEILDDNFQFKISEDIDLEAFNQYLSVHYEQFSHLQKYRKLFKVDKKHINLNST